MLYSTLGAEHSMTAYNGAAPARGLAIALIWWPIAFLLAFTLLHRRDAELPGDQQTGT